MREAVGDSGLQPRVLSSSLRPDISEQGNAGQLAGAVESEDGPAMAEEIEMEVPAKWKKN